MTRSRRYWLAVVGIPAEAGPVSAAIIMMAPLIAIRDMRPSLLPIAVTMSSAARNLKRFYFLRAQ